MEGLPRAMRPGHSQWIGLAVMSATRRERMPVASDGFPWPTGSPRVRRAVSRTASPISTLAIGEPSSFLDPFGREKKPLVIPGRQRHAFPDVARRQSYDPNLLGDRGEYVVRG